MSGHDTRSIDADGHRLAFTCTGTRDDAIVFIHGWAGDRTHWHRQIGSFAGDHRVVAIDLLGHGESDKPDTDYGPVALATGVEAVCDAAGVSSAVFVGHSVGGLVAWTLATRAPGRCRGLVLVDAVLQPSLSAEKVTWMRRALEPEHFAETLAMMVDGFPSDGLDPQDVDRLRAGVTRTPPHVHRAGLDAMTDSTTFDLASIDVPVLAIASARTPTPPEYEDRLNGLAPKLHYETWPAVGHAIQLECPAAFNERLRVFLGDLPPVGGDA